MVGVCFDQLGISEEMVTGANVVAVVVVVAPERPVIDVLSPRLTWHTPSGHVQN